ncbi:hypothetical protein LYNGBM3L_61470 [Moorena producens 3L]|uniref:Uncharacterized protein n=1 Tax=Moorena producens 3L TaxID=489825 RepID=F4Y0J9_9CYAN|nr:hypothetical protein LYNGBM3L_61470 [Moorena producens 3L]
MLRHECEMNCGQDRRPCILNLVGKTNEELTTTYVPKKKLKLIVCSGAEGHPVSLINLAERAPRGLRPCILTIGWSWQEAHTELKESVWEYVTFCWDHSLTLLD